jgi:hypothetical protein
MSRPKIAAVMLVAAVAMPLAVANAASAPKFDVWQGQSKQDKLSVLLVHTQGRKRIQVTVTVPCQNAEGNRTTSELGATTTLSGKGKVTAKGNVGNGEFKLTATAKTNKAATGELTYEVPESFGGCKGTDTFKLKYALSRGG